MFNLMYKAANPQWDGEGDVRLHMDGNMHGLRRIMVDPRNEGNYVIVIAHQVLKE